MWGCGRPPQGHEGPVASGPYQGALARACRSGAVPGRREAAGCSPDIVPAVHARSHIPCHVVFRLPGQDPHRRHWSKGEHKRWRPAWWCSHADFAASQVTVVIGPTRVPSSACRCDRLMQRLRALGRIGLPQAIRTRAVRMAPPLGGTPSQRPLRVRALCNAAATSGPQTCGTPVEAAVVTTLGGTVTSDAADTITVTRAAFAVDGTAGHPESNTAVASVRPTISSAAAPGTQIATHTGVPLPR